MSSFSRRIVITGGAGLVGQNLVIALLDADYRNITVIDKSGSNLQILADIHPDLDVVHADLALEGSWQTKVSQANVVVCLHAQIGGLHAGDFEANNVTATRNVLHALAHNDNCQLVHVSTSAVNSAADDHYTRTKAIQEQLVTESAAQWMVLRPTLMFGWFDRKHLGWLSRFMKKTPLFPVPGNGGYLRQPLYAADFCQVIVSCIEHGHTGQCVEISGKEKIPYLDIIRSIRESIGARTPIVQIPYSMFYLLLAIYALFDRNPPFTVNQLKALVVDELFEDTDWEALFAVRATPFRAAIEQTFNHPRYSTVELEF